MSATAPSPSRTSLTSTINSRPLKNVEEWAGFVVAVTFLSGGLAITHRDVHVFENDGKIITRVNLDTMEPMDVPKMDKRIVELIRELREEGRF